MDGNRIITIGREYGSGGRFIGQQLAARLNIKCYDKELINLASRESGLCPEVFESQDEKPVNSFFYSLVMDTHSTGPAAYPGYMEMPLNQKVFLAQFETIQRLAKKEPCVIVGRCADYALAAHKNLVSVFICADLDDKIARICELYQLPKDKAMDQILKTDKKRANYYNYYSNKKWGGAASYDLCLNSSRIGLDGAVDMILNYLDVRESHQK